MSKELKQAEDIINRVLTGQSDFSLNVIKQALRMLREKTNRKTANKLIDFYDLEKLYGIRKFY